MTEFQISVVPRPRMYVPEEDLRGLPNDLDMIWTWSVHEAKSSNSLGFYKFGESRMHVYGSAATKEEAKSLAHKWAAGFSLAETYKYEPERDDA